MSLWLPKSSPSLLARTCSRPNQHLNLRLITPANQSLHPPLQPTVYILSRRLESTNSSSENARNASTVSRATPEPKPTPPTPRETTGNAPLMTRVWKTVKHEVQHYWHGSKLLSSEVRISSRLVWKILHGESLTRRERRQVRVVINIVYLQMLIRRISNFPSLGARRRICSDSFPSLSL